MEKRKKSIRRAALLLSVLAILVFIYANSLQSGEVSGEESRGLLALVLRIFPFSFLTHHLLRKAAHVAEYALLGVHVGALSLLGGRGTRSVVLSLLFGATVGLSDELVQRFVPGRSGSITDALIDFVGVLLGNVIALLAALIWTRLAAKKKSKAS